MKNPTDHAAGTAVSGGGLDLQALAAREGLPFVSDVADDILVPQLLDRLPVEWARAHKLLPVRIQGRTSVLMPGPGHIDEQEYLELLIGEDLEPVLAPVDVIESAIDRCYFQRDDSAGEFLRDMVEPKPASTRGDHASDLLEDASKAPVTQLVNLILLGAVKQGASDIHFEPFETHLRVRYRIDGVMYEQDGPPKHLEQELVSRLKVMARLDIAEKRLPQDGMARVRVGEREIDIRMSSVPVAEGERMVLRLLDRDSALLPMVSLGMDNEILAGFEELLALPYGIILVCGPTGSGKTTTLYAGLAKLDAARRNILTIEDPVEYRLPNIGQIQVHPKIGLTFAVGLRHILRQDPDIVLVGETRDQETAEIAVRASLTGHLVFTTLHTNDAPGAVIRLVDMGVEPYLLASTLKGVLAQRLVRQLCPACRRETTCTDEALARVPAWQQHLVGRRVWEPVGCDACIEGYHGRTGVFELMVMDERMGDMVRHGETSADALRSAARAGGMQGLLHDGLRKVLSGETSLPEIMNLA